MAVKIPWHPQPIPQTQPHQVHLSHGEDQWLGDSWKAAKKAGRGGKTDTNAHPLFDGVGMIHASTPRQAGYRYIAIGGGRRRPLTAAELDRPFNLWKRRDFVRLRRTRRIGVRFETRVRPLLYAESLAFHRKFGAIMVCELKARMGKERAVAMVDRANREQQTVWFKTLPYQALHAPSSPYSMKAAGEKLGDIKAAGGQTALATHGYPVPHDLEQYRGVIDAYWGTTAKEFRR